ncbi:uncharacterized protein MYCGRDRAFT_91164 [Zymoseptoria tritici IPO323]|uniref:Uncharacterized protein n=1 Tax=Zymoseptoria tritici (strain CBS 115943 / IPO323) TaxID=336722 RepID=F9X403_ZYMTI|nr:uncharacterized protein MYCGRDRAFT_91164 [Zymoseptoria tritici IPO323]EGP90280.1 hypothetical protein MYCGRDRAFT_91164 [Zymoseptoria tritici IPO323]
MGPGTNSMELVSVTARGACHFRTRSSTNPRMKLHIFALLAVFSAVAIADDGGSNNNDRNCEVVGASCRFYGCCKDGACKPDRRGDDGICQLRCEYGGHACDGNILICQNRLQLRAHNELRRGELGP